MANRDPLRDNGNGMDFFGVPLVSGVETAAGTVTPQPLDDCRRTGIFDTMGELLLLFVGDDDVQDVVDEADDVDVDDDADDDDDDDEQHDAVEDSGLDSDNFRLGSFVGDFDSDAGASTAATPFSAALKPFRRGDSPFVAALSFLWPSDDTLLSLFTGATTITAGHSNLVFSAKTLFSTSMSSSSSSSDENGGNDASSMPPPSMSSSTTVSAAAPPSAPASPTVPVLALSTTAFVIAGPSVADDRFPNVDIGGAMEVVVHQ